jgi:Spy/CpxP family protein refolding chaperone
MFPGTWYWWRACHAGPGWAPRWGGEGPLRHWHSQYAQRTEYGDAGGGAFGVRRPLRYLAYKLDLDDAQVAELAKVLHELKTERAQAEVDGRRSMAAFADAVAGESFDEAKATVGASLRVGGAERLRDATIKALGRLHSVLDPEQRERLAYLIRTGALVF